MAAQTGGGRASSANSKVLVHWGVTLREPAPRPNGRADCTCRFCCHFRTKHLWARALAVTSLVPIVGYIVLVVTDTDFHQPNGAGAVGAVLIFFTAVVFLTFVAWYQPVRRAFHLGRPRSTVWPPEWV